MKDINTNALDNFKHTIIFKLLLILSVVGMIVFIIANYLIFKNQESLIVDIEKYNASHLERTLKLIESHIIKKHVEEIKKDILVIAKK